MPVRRGLEGYMRAAVVKRRSRRGCAGLLRKPMAPQARHRRFFLVREREAPYWGEPCVIVIDNYNGSDPATKNTTTGFTLDSLDRLTQVTDPSNLNTIMLISTEN
jgi:hypothetical protein